VCNVKQFLLTGNQFDTSVKTLQGNLFLQTDLLLSMDGRVAEARYTDHSIKTCVKRESVRKNLYQHVADLKPYNVKQQLRNDQQSN
jgi:hypothetical protein